VDDAIVVVENIERNIAEGRTPLAAAHQAMKEVSRPIIAIALVPCAVFRADGLPHRPSPALSINSCGHDPI